MGNQVYTRDHYAVYSARSGYVVHNKKYHFGNSHTHVRSFFDAKRIIHYALKERVPARCNLRFLESMARITDGEYREQVLELLAVREQKGAKDKYYNKTGRKGV